MDYDVEVRKLPQNFYTAYPQTKYPELMKKGRRPYTCLLIDVCEDYLICVPFRSGMPHDQGFHFRGTKRTQHTPSGLDYSKIALTQNAAYIDPSPAVVDPDEYKMVMTNLKRIVTDVTSYIDQYVQHVNGTKPLHPKEFARKYGFSTLPYFHDILGLDSVEDRCRP